MTEEMDDILDDVLVLVDEDGQEVEFEFLDTVIFNDNEYAVLLPTDEVPEGQENDEVVILKIEQDDNGEDTFLSVDSEEELNSVFEEFKRKMQEQYNIKE